MEVGGYERVNEITKNQIILMDSTLNYFEKVLLRNQREERSEDKGDEGNMEKEKGWWRWGRKEERLKEAHSHKKQQNRNNEEMKSKKKGNHLGDMMRHVIGSCEREHQAKGRG